MYECFHSFSVNSYKTMCSQNDYYCVKDNVKYTINSTAKKKPPYTYEIAAVQIVRLRIGGYMLKNLN